MPQAAKYYELASSWGHATAMYNLGVFYVHGWGGVPVDCDRARQLFVAAAKLGQSNAQEALSMVPPAGEEDVTGKLLACLVHKARSPPPHFKLK